MKINKNKKLLKFDIKPKHWDSLCENHLLRLVSKLKFPKNYEKYQQVMVFLSGGVDSTTLFYVLYHLYKSQKIRALAVFHMNYRLRGDDSQRDAAFCAQLGALHGIEVKLEKPTSPAPAHGIQEWARNERRKKCDLFAAEGWTVALGHHADDQLETFLFRMARGSSPLGLKGMRSYQKPIWRPLLDLSKKTLEESAAAAGILYRSDVSNLSTDYKRNVLRHQVIPPLQQVNAQAAKHVLTVQQDMRELLKIAQNLAHQGLARDNSGYFLPSLWLREQSFTVFELAVYHLIKSSGFVRKRPHLLRTQLRQAYRAVRQGSGEDKFLSLTKNLTLVVNHEKVHLRETATTYIPKIMRQKQHSLTRQMLPVNIETQTSSSIHLELSECLKIDLPMAKIAPFLQTLGLKSTNHSMRLGISLPTQNCTVETPQGRGSWKFADIMKKWSIAVVDRPTFLLVSFNGKKCGLYRKGALFCVDGTGRPLSIDLNS